MGQSLPTIVERHDGNSGRRQPVESVNQVAVWEPIPYHIQRCNSSWADDRTESVGWILNRNSPAPGT